MDAALAVVAPHLELLLQLARPGAAQPQPPAAILLLIVRVSHAALSLMRPPHCRQHAQLLQRMARTCHALLAPPPHAGPPVDFGDPMAGCLHKHAARLWVGLSVLCGAAACPSVLLPPSSSGGGAVAAEKDLVQSWGGDLVGRLQQCLASPNLDTRAGAAKALATLTAALQRHTWCALLSCGSWSGRATQMRCASVRITSLPLVLFGCQVQRAGGACGPARCWSQRRAALALRGGRAGGPGALGGRAGGAAEPGGGGRAHGAAARGAGAGVAPPG